jgi:hypothetical protein
MAPDIDQSTCATKGGARHPAKHSAQTDARKRLTAFNDDQLRSWLMKCIEDGSENFLGAVAEAAVAASAEDYVVIRPALLTLRRKHNGKR